jgi:RNA polymerase sigma-70 factor (ECF subfamily)
VVLLREARERTDEDLVKACQQGDATAFDALMGRYKDRLHAVVYRYLGRHEDTAEVCQDAFVKAYFAINDFRGEAKFSTWLISIAANLARNSLRDRQRKGRDKGSSLEAMSDSARTMVDRAMASKMTPRGDAVREETEAVLQDCLGQLDDAMRMTFVLRMYEEMSYQEIAEVTEVPLGTVKSRLNGARSALRTMLNDRDILPS